MKKIALVLILVFLVFAGYETLRAKNEQAKLTENLELVETKDIKEEEIIPPHLALFQELGLEDKVSFQAFDQAMTGYETLNIQNPILTLIDFSKPSTEERFYVINLDKKEILFETVVAHGKRSGENYATSFSNKSGSCQSSLGFFLTEQTYKGKAGLSLTLNGLEKGINDNVRKRGVVIHGAAYANPEKAKYAGRLGRSQGCPALPVKINKPVIDVIKNGTLVFAYSELFNEDYLVKSTVLN